MSEQGVALDQLLGYVEQALRGNRSLLVQLFRTMQKLAHHPSAPESERKLGEILSLILMGERSPDLDQLPEDMAAEINAMLKRLKDDCPANDRSSGHSRN
ncbi:MAG: hypothetical protein GX495_04515 [Chloroflexi bacterium]|jgi:hypothetical protein|nr:hypothetical protein [Chloroflexota bacterium]